MKKSSAIIVSLVTILIIIISFIAIFKKKNELKITIIPRDYHYLYEEDEEIAIDIAVLINQKDSSLINKDNILKCYLYDQDSMYLLKLLNIKELDRSIKIKNEIFYKYNYYFVLMGYLENDVINMDEAKLSLEMVDITLDLEIGCVTLKKVDYFGHLQNELALSYLKGLTIEEDYRKKLSAIIIGFRNNTNQGIVVNNISLVASGVTLSNLEMQQLPDPIINQEDYQFNLYTNYSNNNISFSLAANEVKYFMIPVKYEKSKYLSRCGFEIDYSKNGNFYKIYFDDFLFFSESIIKDQALNNLTIYRYGSN